MILNLATAFMFLSSAQTSTTPVVRPIRDTPRVVALTAPKPEIVEIKLPSIPPEIIDDYSVAARPEKRFWTLAPRPRGEWPSHYNALGGPKVVYRHYRRAVHEDRCPPSGMLAYDFAAMVKRGFAFEFHKTLQSYVPLASFPGYGIAPLYYPGRWGSQIELSPQNRLIIRFPIAEKQGSPQITAMGKVRPARFECQGGFAVDIWVKGPKGVDPLTGRRTDATPERNPLALDKPVPRFEPARPAVPAGPGPVIRDKPRR